MVTGFARLKSKPNAAHSSSLDACASVPDHFSSNASVGLQFRTDLIKNSSKQLQADEKMSTPRQRYSRVPTDDAATTRAAAKKRRSELAEQVATKIQAAAWVAAGGFVAYQTDLPVVLLAGTETNRFWCDVAAACFAANCVLCFYLTVWLPHVQRIDLEWNVYCPRVIPTMTVLGLTCGFSLIRGLWPVWGLLTPLILGLVAMACLMSLHFIPIPC